VITAFRTIDVIGQKIAEREGVWSDKPGGAAGRRGNILLRYRSVIFFRAARVQDL
jgi:hypothetical protein